MSGRRVYSAEESRQETRRVGHSINRAWAECFTAYLSSPAPEIAMHRVTLHRVAFNRRIIGHKVNVPHALDNILSASGVHCSPISMRFSRQLPARKCFEVT